MIAVQTKFLGPTNFLALRGTLISKLPGYDGAGTWGIE